MKMDIVGRVKNIVLFTNKPLLPLFEAIMNSIQAIDEAKINDGRIKIEIIREATLLESEKTKADIIGFNIKDNGVGFDDQNYDAFITSDTTRKASSGGKGIGRFMWLAAFDKVEIKSVYKDSDKMKERKFTFSVQGDGVGNHQLSVVDKNRETEVGLMNFKEKYRKASPKRAETIAILIVEQFLDIYIRGECPIITLHDSSGGDEISLDKFYEEIVSKIEQREIEIKKEKFILLFIRLYSKHVSDHKLSFCAHDRVVMNEKLTGIPNLEHRLVDQDGQEFVCAVYVNSKVLDNVVNSERTGFRLSEETGELFDSDISMSDVRDAVKITCKEYLDPFTGPVAVKKRKRIESFIQEDGIMYRPILKYLESKVDEIDPNASNNEIDLALYGGYQNLQMDLRQKGQELLQDSGKEDNLDWEEYQKKFNDYFEKITEANRADLTRYVCHRKAIIEFFKKQLNVQSDGKYAPEERVHSIIFPRGQSSDDTSFHEHNLWLVDERLAFHAFLSSDQPIKKLKVLQNDSKKEPDILIFDKAVAFADSTTPFTSISIVEFKRPVRKDYSENENPFIQVARYIDAIRAGKALTPEGRPVNIPDKLPFYCFVICDITEGFKEWARLFELQITPDGLGYFGYKRDYCAYFEVISYDKLVADAEKRHQAFFEKIGLGKTGK